MRGVGTVLDLADSMPLYATCPCCSKSLGSVVESSPLPVRCKRRSYVSSPLKCDSCSGWASGGFGLSSRACVMVLCPRSKPMPRKAPPNSVIFRGECESFELRELCARVMVFEQAAQLFGTSPGQTPDHTSLR
eukprot:761497-Rhodomonas_salina.1